MLNVNILHESSVFIYFKLVDVLIKNVSHVDKQCRLIQFLSKWICLCKLVYLHISNLHFSEAYVESNIQIHYSQILKWKYRCTGKIIPEYTKSF